MARVIVPVTSLTPPKASLTTALTGTNNDLVYTAAVGGPGGNSIRVQYIDPGGVSATLSIALAGYDILVSLGRAASAINTTASQVAAIVAANAGRLVSTANAGSDTGAGLVTAMTITNLTGGSFQTTPPSQTNGDATNDHYFTGNDGLTFIEVVSSDAGAQTVAIQYSPTYAQLTAIPAQSESVPAGATRLLGPFSASAFNQNSAGDVYFDPSVSTNLKFRVYRTVKSA